MKETILRFLIPCLSGIVVGAIVWVTFGIIYVTWELQTKGFASSWIFSPLVVIAGKPYFEVVVYDSIAGIIIGLLIGIIVGFIQPTNSQIQSFLLIAIPIATIVVIYLSYNATQTLPDATSIISGLWFSVFPASITIFSVVNILNLMRVKNWIE